MRNAVLMALLIIVPAITTQDAPPHDTGTVTVLRPARVFECNARSR